MNVEFRGPQGGPGPVQRPPSEWEKRPLGLGKEPAQGPMKTSRPTMRDLNPTAGPGTNYSNSIIDARPGVAAQRALAPIPGEVVTVLAQGVGGAIEQHLVGGSFVSTAPGDDGNVAGNGDYTGAADFAKGSASKVTGGMKAGTTGGKGTI
jgi:hypothetical protein